MRKQFMNNYELDIMLHKTERARDGLVISDKSLDKMNKVIIRNHNERIKSNDILFHIGDFMFRNSKGGKKGEGKPIKVNEILKQLTGNIIRIDGNHEKSNQCSTKIQNIVIKIGNQFINLVHNPEHANVKYPINLTGHVHQRWAFKRIEKEGTFTDCINVGVDINKFYPVTWNELMAKYHRWLRNNNLEVRI